MVVLHACGNTPDPSAATAAATATGLNGVGSPYSRVADGRHGHRVEELWVGLETPLPPPTSAAGLAVCWDWGSGHAMAQAVRGGVWLVGMMTIPW